MNTNIMPDMSQGEEKLKSYWNRPGGKLGMIIGIGLLTIAGYFLFPILTAVVWNTLNFAIALTATGAFLWVATNRKTRLAFYYLYNMGIKYTVGLVIEKLKELYKKKFTWNETEEMIFDGVIADYYKNNVKEKLFDNNVYSINFNHVETKNETPVATPKHGFDGGEEYSNVWTTRVISGVVGLAFGLVIAFFGTVIWHSLG